MDVYQTVKYESDLSRQFLFGGPRHCFQMRVRPEIVDWSPDNRNSPNEESPIDITVPITLLSTLNRDRSGLYPRGVVAEWTTTPPDGYSAEGTIFIPVFRRGTFAVWKILDTGTFMGSGVIIIAKRNETLRS
jgi:hypothetical protein